jgi:hypothetical protein
MSTKYLLKGTEFAGGSDFVGSGRQWKSAEYDFFAENDAQAREKAKRFSEGLSSQRLFVEISLSEEAPAADNQQKRTSKMKYRVISSRHDVSPRIAGEFEALDDDEARRVFDDEYAKNKDYGFDWLDLQRIDQVEKSTIIDHKG